MRRALLLAVLSYGCSADLTRVQAAEAESPDVTVGDPSAAVITGLDKVITLKEFLQEVAASNLEYAAQRYNVSIAEAALAAAKAFQNPSLQAGQQRDVTHSGNQRLSTTVSSGLTQTIELGRKRKYRIENAQQNYAAAGATLDDFVHNLRLDATAAFVDALAAVQKVEQRRQAAEYLHQLADTQREQFSAGDISKADMLETRVEEQQFETELLAAQAEADNSSSALNAFIGSDRQQVHFVPKGNLKLAVRAFDAAKLVADALQSRADLIALRHKREAAESNLELELSNRIPNVDLGVNWMHSTKSDNTIAPAPKTDFLMLSFAFPLPLWNRNEAAISGAREGVKQAETQLKAAELKTSVQIRRAFGTWTTAVERVRRYDGGILKDAQAVLDAKRFSYQRGQSTLLELLEAQRTANELRAGYNDALADQAKAFIELQRASGMFDVDI